MGEKEGVGGVVWWCGGEGVGGGWGGGLRTWPKLTFHAVGGEEADVLGLQGVVMGELRRAALGL